MQIKTTNYQGEFVHELKYLVEMKVDGSDYDLGRLETLEKTVSNQTELLAKIIEHLNPSNEVLNDWLGTYMASNLTKIL